MWKTTDRYVQQKRVKAVEAELKLKQVYIPQYNNNGKGNGASGVKAGSGGGSGGSIYNGTTNGGADLSNNGKPCESCGITKSSQVSGTLSTEYNKFLNFFAIPLVELLQQWSCGVSSLPELLGLLAKVRKYEVGTQGRCQRW